ncbi:MAG: phosphoribosyltransferase family protein [Bdellovibrionota bacterium]|nr:MAG: phosphoribosyltransferase family protein [Bdellovibrionota bacterium]
MQLPPHFQQVFSGEQIDEAVKRMGRAISVWAEEVWQSSHTEILTIPVLRGAIFFYADLVRAITRSVEIAPTRTWAYEDNAVQRSDLRMHLDEVPAAGRAVLIVDDICDTGRTLEKLSQGLKAAGAREVRSAVMVRRILDTQTFKPDWQGFEYPGAEWLVGYGMDDNNQFRNLHQICAIRQVG